MSLRWKRWTNSPARSGRRNSFWIEPNSGRRVALVLGSGLGDFADDLQHAVRIPFAEIPFFPKSTAIGHAGALVIGTFDGMPVAVMQGRVHFYEGYSFQQVAFPVRVLAWMGVNALVLTNAAGGINAEYKLGALVVLRDHINLQGGNPLIGPNDDRFGPRFPDMTDAYNATFRGFALDEAERLEGGIHEGVYAALPGPSFETPAEIRALRTIGADLVGMSTVPEVIVARHMGLGGAGDLVCDEHGCRHDRGEAHPYRGAGDGTARAWQVSRAGKGCAAEDRALSERTRGCGLRLLPRQTE